MLGLEVAGQTIIWFCFLMFSNTVQMGGKMALYIWLSLTTSRYLICFWVLVVGNIWRGGFFLLVNTNDFWVTILSILTPLELAVASVIFSLNLRGISYFPGEVTSFGGMFLTSRNRAAINRISCNLDFFLSHWYSITLQLFL